MIALRGGLPLIQLGTGEAVAFDPDWMARALKVSAARAGHPDWWLASHVANSVKEWLKDLRDYNTLPSTTLALAVRKALEAIGFRDVADEFCSIAPFARIALLEVAQAAGNGFELAFFRELEHRLKAALEHGGTYCELHGLRSCVKWLRKCARWQKDCNDLRAEIVEFARAHSTRSGTHLAGKPLFLHVV